MTDVNLLKAKFETQASPSTNGASPKPPGKPLVGKKPPVSPKVKTKVNKLSPALMKKLEGGHSLTGTAVHEGELRLGQKHWAADGSHGMQKSHSADGANTVYPSPGASILASISRTSPNPPRRAPPPPPSTSPELHTSPTSKPQSPPTTPPRPGPSPPKPLPSPPKPRPSPIMRLDSREEKARSMEVGRLPKPLPTTRPLSTGTDHRVNLRRVGKSETDPGSSPVVDTPHGNFSSAKKPVTSSYEKSLDSLVHIDSPFMPRATSHDSSCSPPEKNYPVAKGSGSLEELRGNVAERERAVSLPRFSASPPPVENSGLQLPQSKLRSHSDLHLNRISGKDKPVSPQRKLSDGPKPSVRPKPAILPRPPVPHKPPSLTNLKDHPGYSRPVRSASSSRDPTPEPSKARTSSTKEWTPEPLGELSSSKIGPQPVLIRDQGGESEGTVTTATESSEEERITSPDTPVSANVGRKPPSIELSVPETGASRSGGRNNVDSGFVSEAPEDLVREVSVDSVASTEEKGSIPVKEVEVWDDEKVSVCECGGDCEGVEGMVRVWVAYTVACTQL